MYSRHPSCIIDLIVNLFHHISKTPSAHDQPDHKTRPLSITIPTMPPDPRRESHRSSYIKSAAYQIAQTPIATPQEFPGSFQENNPDYTERPVKNVPHPATNKPKDDEFFAYDRNGAPIPNLDFIREHFLAEGKLTEQQAIYILDRATDLLSREPNLLPVPSPVTVCGDIHGQFVVRPHEDLRSGGNCSRELLFISRRLCRPGQFWNRVSAVSLRF